MLIKESTAQTEIMALVEAAAYCQSGIFLRTAAGKKSPVKKKSSSSKCIQRSCEQVSRGRRSACVLHSISCNCHAMDLGDLTYSLAGNHFFIFFTSQPVLHQVSCSGTDILLQPAVVPGSKPLMVLLEDHRLELQGKKEMVCVKTFPTIKYKP